MAGDIEWKWRRSGAKTDADDGYGGAYGGDSGGGGIGYNGRGTEGMSDIAESIPTRSGREVLPRRSYSYAGGGYGAESYARAYQDYARTVEEADSGAYQCRDIPDETDGDVISWTMTSEIVDNGEALGRTPRVSRVTTKRLRTCGTKSIARPRPKKKAARARA